MPNPTNIELDQPVQLINTVSKPPARRCSQCGHPYYRVNAASLWTIRTPGKRLGWHKEIVKVCLKCMTKKQAEQVIRIADIQFSDKEVIRQAKR